MFKTGDKVIINSEQFDLTDCFGVVQRRGRFKADPTIIFFVLVGESCYTLLESELRKVEHEEEKQGQDH